MADNRKVEYTWTWEENGENMAMAYCPKHYMYHGVNDPCAICTGEAKPMIPVISVTPTNHIPDKVKDHHPVGCLCAECQVKKAAARWNNVEMDNYEKERKEFAALKADRDSIEEQARRLINVNRELKEDLANRNIIMLEDCAMFGHRASIAEPDRCVRCAKVVTAIPAAFNIPHPIPVAKCYTAKVALAKPKEDHWEVDEWDLLPDAD